MDQRSKVLLVDDEADILAAAKAYLEVALDADILTCPSGSEALLRLKEGLQVDLIISDYRMPGLDGLRFLVEAGKVLPDRPRVLLTAYPDMQLAITALNEAHITKFLTKPVDPMQLETIARDLLDASRRQRLGKQALDRAAAGRPSAPAAPPTPKKGP